MTASQSSTKTPSSSSSSSSSSTLPSSSCYNLRRVITPTLAGLPLLIATKLLRVPILGRLIIAFTKAMNDFGCVSRLAEGTVTTAGLMSYMPLYYPFPGLELLEARSEKREDDGSAYFSMHEELAKKFHLERFIAEQNENDASEELHQDFRYWTIQDYLSKYISQQLTPYQVALAIVKAVKQSSQSPCSSTSSSSTSSSPSRHIINAITAMNEHDVLEQARQSTKRYHSKQGIRPLEGVPIAIKDEISLKNYPTTHGTTFLGELNGISVNDCIIVQRLKSAGAIIVGKTNMHELGVGTTGFNWTDTGMARNPHNTNHYTGGSSSGSAAAVSAGLVPLAVGLDGGGSIRIPSSLCGVVGLKPTFGRGDLDMKLCYSLGHVGPIGGSVVDVAIGYAVMAGLEGNDHDDGALQVKNVKGHVQIPPLHLARFGLGKDLSKLKFGIFEDYFNDADSEVVDACWKAVGHLESLGAKRVNVSIPNMEETKVAHSITILTELAAGGTSRYYDRFINKFTPETQISAELGRSITGLEFLHAQKVRRFAMKVLYNHVFSKVDVFITPGTGCTAPKILDGVLSYGESNLAQTTNLMRFIYHGNLCGIPGVVVPIGYSRCEKLPISLQIQAPHWDEDVILGVAKSLESFAVREKPMVFFDIMEMASKE